MEIEVFTATDIIFFGASYRILEKVHPHSNSETTRTDVQLREKIRAFHFKNVILFSLLPITQIIWNMKVSTLDHNPLISSILCNLLGWEG